MICKQCKKQFTHKRATAKYCCSTCRSNARHNKNREGVEMVQDQVKQLPKKVMYTGKHNAFDICPKHKIFFNSCKCA